MGSLNCGVLNVARPLHGWPEGSLKSCSSRVYGVINMFSAEPRAVCR